MYNYAFKTNENTIWLCHPILSVGSSSTHNFFEVSLEYQKNVHYCMVRNSSVMCTNRNGGLIKYPFLHDVEKLEQNLLFSLSL